MTSWFYEPQRGILEKKLRSELQNYKGDPTYYNYLSTDGLQKH
jgi:hypothetical protein